MTRRRNGTRWSSRSGMTILEVMVVLTIVAMIAAVAAPRFIGYVGRAKPKAAALQLKNLESAVQLFYIDMGRYPTGSEGLAALLVAPPGDPSWAGPYLQTEDGLVDPWGRDYLYGEPSEGETFSIVSLGRDGETGGAGEDADLSY